MISQGYKEIPKTIRTNWTCLVVFEIGNEREVFVIYEEFAMGLKAKDWLEAYEHCTSGDHSFMFLNYQNEKQFRLMKNFDNYVFVVPEEKRSGLEEVEVGGKRKLGEKDEKKLEKKARAHEKKLAK